MNPDVLVSNPDTINPYMIAWKLIKDRLRWDLGLTSWQSRQKIAQWKNKYSGQKAVILCNGPSLLQTDFTLLRDTFTFGLNKVNLLTDQVDFRPSCIVAVNKLVLEQNREYYNNTDLPLFLDRAALEVGVTKRSKVHFLHSTNQRRFARDCRFSVFQGYTVTYVALQLAFHMGFSRVALIGADHSFSGEGKPNQVVEAGEADPNHFDPRYFANGTKWQLPDIVESELSYTMARYVFDAFGRRVVNATVGGELEIFERQPLEVFVGSD